MKPGLFEQCPDLGRVSSLGLKFSHELVDRLLGFFVTAHGRFEVFLGTLEDLADLIKRLLRFNFFDLRFEIIGTGRVAVPFGSRQHDLGFFL